MTALDSKRPAPLEAVTPLENTGAKPPNILFFFTDDQRFDTIAALNNEEIITPCMDSFVRDGTTFANAYIMGGSCPAVCMPSRAMLMSGRTLYHLDRQGQTIPESHLMLPEVLQQAGYMTFGTGKWHNGPETYARGFTTGAEIFFGGMNDHWNVPAANFDPTGEYPEDKRHCRKGKHSSELFSDTAIDFLRRYDGDDPFFMYVSYMAPHDPRTMPRKYLEMYDPARITLPANFLPEHPFDNGELTIRDEKLEVWPRTPEAIRGHIRDYYAMITHVDAEMGRVMETLRERGFAENTVIVFAGDNGLAVGRHGLMGKQNMYDHSVHVPLIMCGPGIPQGERRDAYCYLLDIFPTLCELAVVPAPETVEGRSLVPVMENPDHRVRDTLLFAYRGFQRSVQDARYKLIEYVVNGERATQLFDLVDDPWETNNLADDPACAEHVARLRKALARWRDELDDTQPGQGEAFWRGFDAGA